MLNLLRQSTIPHQTIVNLSPPSSHKQTVRTIVDSATIHPVIGVIGSKGGVGTSTICTNLAVKLLESLDEHQRITVLDANLQQPDIALMLDLPLTNSIMDVFDKISDLDERLFAACLTEIADTQGRARLLSAPLTGYAAIHGDLSILSDCLSRVRQFSDAWVIDLPNKLDGHLVHMLDQCDVIALVVEPDFAAITAGKRWLEFLQDLGRRASEIFIVVNRADSQPNKNMESKLTDVFADFSLVTVPNAYVKSGRCFASGRSLVQMHPRDKFAKSIAEICALILGHLAKETASHARY